MTKDLLWRGMLAGILAALLATLFAHAFGEPQVERAIAHEAAQHSAHHHHHDHGDGPAISRDTQKGLGLTTAVLLYGAAMGGIFSLLFAYCYGRIGTAGPRTLALALALLGFVAIVLVPGLVYPPSPPGVGQAETIQMRTAGYFAMIAISLVGLILSARTAAMLRRHAGGFNAMLIALASYILVVAIAQAGLPRMDEAPAGFPAALLWNFRIASAGMQLVLWAGMGIIFGWLAERRLQAQPGRAARAA